MDEENGALLGYFSLTFKEITYPKDAVSNTATRRAGGLLEEDSERIRVKAYLIGQLGKNSSIDNNCLNLEKILAEAYGVINEARELIGGRAIIVECMQNEKLISLYEAQGFKLIEMEPNHRGDVTLYIVVKS